MLRMSPVLRASLPSPPRHEQHDGLTNRQHTRRYHRRKTQTDGCTTVCRSSRGGAQRCERKRPRARQDPRRVFGATKTFFTVAAHDRARGLVRACLPLSPLLTRQAALTHTSICDTGLERAFEVPDYRVRLSAILPLSQRLPFRLCQVVERNRFCLLPLASHLCQDPAGITPGM